MLAIPAGCNLDVKLGRQVLTWGTGDLLFLNDLFPKDWVSFFAGRDDEYLKAPSNTLRATQYNGSPISISRGRRCSSPIITWTGNASLFLPAGGRDHRPGPPLRVDDPTANFQR